MIASRLMSPRFALSLAVSATLWGAMSVAQAQVPFPAPLPGQSSAPAFPAPLPGGQAAPAAAPANASPASPGLAPMQPLANAPAAFPSDGAPAPGGFSAAPSGPQAGPPPGAAKCQEEFMPLRKDVEKRMASIQGLGKRKAPASEACAALRSLGTAETKMIKYVEVNAQKCGIPEQAHKQLNENHAHTTKLATQVCNVAAQQAQAQQRGPSGPSLSDVLGSPALPEARPAKRGGGSTFDTLSGNVLAR